MCCVSESAWVSARRPDVAFACTHLLGPGEAPTIIHYGFDTHPRHKASGVDPILHTIRPNPFHHGIVEHNLPVDLTVVQVCHHFIERHD